LYKSKLSNIHIDESGENKFTDPKKLNPVIIIDDKSTVPEICRVVLYKSKFSNNHIDESGENKFTDPKKLNLVIIIDDKSTIAEMRRIVLC
jgi:hypothetical protein